MQGSVRTWVIGGVALAVLLLLGANGHMLYVALSSAPGCSEETVIAGDGGTARTLRPAKDGC